MSATAFQRRRREIARLRAAATEVLPEHNEPTAGQDEPQNEHPKVLAPNDVDDMDIEKVKEFLEHYEVKFAHNTGEAKLREKLKDAIG